MSFIRVDLPEPFGPIMAIFSSDPICRLISSKIFEPSLKTVTFLKSMKFVFFMFSFLRLRRGTIRPKYSILLLNKRDRQKIKLAHYIAPQGRCYPSRPKHPIGAVGAKVLPAKDCEAPFDFQNPKGISPPWRGRPCPLKTDKDGGGLPNGARAKHSLATIKQGGFFMRIAKRRGSAEHLLR